MRDKTIEAMRLVLTITGLVLLFVFGTRAASQANNMQLAGKTRHNFTLPTFTINALGGINTQFADAPANASIFQLSHSTNPDTNSKDWQNTATPTASHGTPAAGSLRHVHAKPQQSHKPKHQPTPQAPTTPNPVAESTAPSTKTMPDDALKQSAVSTIPQP